MSHSKGDLCGLFVLGKGDVFNKAATTVSSYRLGVLEHIFSMFRSAPPRNIRTRGRSQVIFMGGLVSALLALVLLLLAYLPW